MRLQLHSFYWLSCLMLVSFFEDVLADEILPTFVVLASCNLGVFGTKARGKCKERKKDQSNPKKQPKENNQEQSTTKQTNQDL